MSIHFSFFSFFTARHLLLLSNRLIFHLQLQIEGARIFPQPGLPEGVLTFAKGIRSRNPAQQFPHTARLVPPAPVPGSPTMVPWYHGAMKPWCHVTMVAWYHGTIVPCYHDTKFHGSMRPWSRTWSRK